MATKVQRIMTQPIVRRPFRTSRPPRSARARLSSPMRPDARTHPTPLTEPPPTDSSPSPQNLIFRFLQTKARIQIWLYENTDTVVEGRIIVSTRPRVSYLPTRASQGSPPDEPIDHIFRVNGSLLAVAAGVWFFFGFLDSHPRR